MIFIAVLRGLRKISSTELKPISHFCNSCRSKFTLKMSQAHEVYLRIENETGKFRLSFLYCDDESGARRELHFHRNLQDIVQPFCNRIALKLNPPVSKKKHKVTTPEEKTAISVQFLKSGHPVCGTISCQELFSTDNSDLTLRINNQDFCFITNAPWIQNIALPKSIMAGFILYPHKLEGLFINENESEFLWFKCKDDGKDKLVGSGPFYIPSATDIGYKLKLLCTPVNNGLKGPMVEVYSSCEVEAGPGHCPFEDRHVFTENYSTGHSFRVVSYNILADLYATSTTGKEELFTYCPPYALIMDYRKQLLFKELFGSYR